MKTIDEKKQIKIVGGVGVPKKFKPVKLVTGK